MSEGIRYCTCTGQPLPVRLLSVSIKNTPYLRAGEASLCARVVCVAHGDESLKAETLAEGESFS